MPLFKRGNTWWIDAIAPSGERIRRTTGTESKALAQEFHDNLKAELWRVSKLGDKPRHTWNEAVVRWLKDQAHKATINTDKIHLRWLDQFLSGKRLDTISRSMIDKITESRLSEGVSNATVNRMLEVLRAILRRSVNDWEWVDKTPMVRMLKEPTRRIRYLTREEANRLLAELPAHLADMVGFSLATGLRRSNVTGLQWSQVNLEKCVAWIHADQAKARKAIPVPLNSSAVAIIRKNLGQHPTHVFCYRGTPVPKSAPRLGTPHWSALEFTIFAGTIYGTLGQAGMCNTARHYSPCRKWGAGRARKW
jgi:integrase